MRDTLLHVFKIVVSIVIPLAAFTTGLRAVTLDPLGLFKQPRLLLRSLLATLIVIPIGAIVFLRMVHATPLVTAGIVVSILAIGLGPPALMAHTKETGGSVDYEVEMAAILLVLAIVFVPVAVALAGRYFHVDVHLDASRVAVLVLTRALIPLLVGVVVARVFPHASGRLAHIANPIVNVALLAIVLFAVLATGKSLLGIGGRAWLTCFAVAAGATAVGHFLGGPEPLNRRVLATISAMRFPALALLIASVTTRDKELIPVVLAYVIASIVVVALYVALTSRLSKAKPKGHTRPAVPAARPA